MFVRAQVSKGKNWKIDFTVTCDGSDERHRNEFGLNRIDDLAVRELVAEGICQFLNKFDFNKVLPAVLSPEKADVPTLRAKMLEVKADKMGYERSNTRKTYRTAIDKFLQWAEKEGCEDMPWTEFSQRQAKKYLSDLRASGDLAARTLNNNLTLIRTVFTDMAEGDKRILNPFSAQKKVRVLGKNRRAFTDEERKVVAAYIREQDYWLFRGILLQYYCYIRPVELSRLRFRNFDLARGIVVIETYEAKCWKERTATIPAAIMHYFRDGIFDKQPASWFLFGRVGNGSKRTEDKMAPSAKAARVDRPYKKHRFYLEKLRDAGRITNIEGLTWYSWKDTGVSKHVLTTSPLATRDQAGHSKFDMTLTYYTSQEVNKEYQGLGDDLLG